MKHSKVIKKWMNYCRGGRAGYADGGLVEGLGIQPPELPTAPKPIIGSNDNTYQPDQKVGSFGKFLNKWDKPKNPNNHPSDGGAAASFSKGGMVKSAKERYEEKKRKRQGMPDRAQAFSMALIRRNQNGKA